MNKSQEYGKSVSFEMDNAVEELRMTKTSFLYQSVLRNVEFVNKVELPSV